MLLHIHVTPNAKHARHEEQTDLMGAKVLKIRLTVPPIDGKANDALIDYLSTLYDLPKSSFTIKHGLTSRHKIVEIKK